MRRSLVAGFTFLGSVAFAISSATARAEDAGSQTRVFVEEPMAPAWLAGVRSA